MIFKENQFINFIQKPSSDIRVVVIYGPNLGLIGEYYEKAFTKITKNNNDPFNIITLSSNSFKENSSVLMDEVSSFSLLGGSKSIFIKEIDATIKNSLKEYLKNPIEESLVIINAGDLKNSDSLITSLKKAKNAAVIACYDDKAADISQIATNKLRDAGISIERDALGMLANNISSDRQIVNSEIDKIITYAGDNKNIKIRDIRLLIGNSSEYSNDDLCYAIALGKDVEAQKIYSRMINEGIEPVSIIRSINMHFQKIFSVVSQIDNKTPIESAINSLIPRIIFFRMADFRKQVSIWNGKSLQSIFGLLLKAEKESKSTNYPNIELVSRLILQISVAAKKSAVRR